MLLTFHLKNNKHIEVFFIYCNKKPTLLVIRIWIKLETNCTETSESNFVSKSWRPNCLTPIIKFGLT